MAKTTAEDTRIMLLALGALVVCGGEAKHTKIGSLIRACDSERLRRVLRRAATLGYVEEDRRRGRKGTTWRLA